MFRTPAYADIQVPTFRASWPPYFCASRPSSRSKVPQKLLAFIIWRFSCRRSRRLAVGCFYNIDGNDNCSRAPPAAARKVHLLVYVLAVSLWGWRATTASVTVDDGFYGCRYGTNNILVRRYCLVFFRISLLRSIGLLLMGSMEHVVE